MAQDKSDKMKAITDKLEKGIQDLFESEKYKDYLKTMSKFYNYSDNNILLITMQNPNATYVAGYKAWQSKFGRYVKKGESGIKIIAPTAYTVIKEITKIDPLTTRPIIGANGKPEKETVKTQVQSYRIVSVFDVSQNEGKELPQLAVQLKNDVRQFNTLWNTLKNILPVPISIEDIEESVNGYYDLNEKRIVINKGLGELQTIKTAVHEIAHATLHDIDLNKPLSKQNIPDNNTREVQAESIAYVVCQHYGLDTSDYSFGYIVGWSDGKELNELKSSLETIRSTSNNLITKIDENMEQILTMKQSEQTKEPIQEKQEQEQTQEPVEDMDMEFEMDLSM